jgi:glycosyltransferase involved in cell wall biosynthesis
VTIRVLHVFAPNFRQRFGGPVFNWQLYFSKWDDRSIEHFVLDTEAGKILPAKIAFNFDINGPQRISSRKERLGWIFHLLSNLSDHRNSYDLIHFHILWWGSLLAANWASQRNIPTIYESVLLEADTPGAIGRERFGNIKLQILRKFTSILAISDGIVNDYLFFGFSPFQVQLHMNAIDTDLFRPLADPTARQRLRQSFSLPSDNFVLLFTGSLIHRKGVDVLIEAFIEAAKRNPSLFLWLVGPKNQSENPSVDEVFVTSMQQKVAEAGLADRVSFYGLIADRDKLAEAYQAADLFVFPSRKEGLPNVVLEAMACGLPVVVSDLPGLKNVIKPNDNGIVIPIDSVQPLAQQIQCVAENPDKAQLFSLNAHMYIQSRHGFTAWQKKIASYYHQLAG